MSNKDCLKGITVENMRSHAGNVIPNQFKIYTPDGVILQSYSSVIAIKYNDGRVVLGKDWDYSRTTGKYRNDFLREGIAETRKKLEAGIYELDEEL